MSIQVFQKELGKRTGTVQVLKRSGRELIENSRDDTTWVKVQLQELSNRWDTVCKLSVSKQTRLEQALKQVRRKKCGWTQSWGALLGSRFVLHQAQGRGFALAGQDTPALQWFLQINGVGNPPLLILFPKK